MGAPVLPSALEDTRDPSAEPHRGALGAGGVVQPDSATPPRPPPPQPDSSFTPLTPVPIRLRQTTDVNLSKEVALFLIEIYFERHYQSQLLFSKQSFVSGYLANELPDYVLLAVFAFASVFLAGGSGRSIPHNVTISDIPQVDWGVVGEDWAEVASQKALSGADRPRLQIAQACQVLGLFWFSKSQTMRTHMHMTVAHVICHLLRYDQISQDELLGEDSFQRELQLRCYWACWLTKCASQQRAAFQSDCWSEIAGLPLPPDNEPWGGASRRPTLSLDRHGILEGTGVEAGRRILGSHSAMIILYGLWWEIQSFIRSMRDGTVDPSNCVSRMFSLERKLEDLQPQILHLIQWPPNLTRASTAAESESCRAFCLNALYRLCICALHSSIVPALSSNSQKLRVSRKMIRLSAEQAIHHSTSMADMTMQFLATKADIGKLWPIVGYCIFVTAVLQLRYFIAVNTVTHEKLRRLHAHLQLLGGLNRYWSMLKCLEENLSRMLAHTSSIILPNGGMGQQSGEQGIQDEEAAFERLVEREVPNESPASAPDIYTYVSEERSEERNPRGNADPGTSTSSLDLEYASSEVGSASQPGTVTALAPIQRTSPMGIPMQANCPEPIQSLQMLGLETPSTIWWGQEYAVFASIDDGHVMYADPGSQMEWY